MRVTVAALTLVAVITSAGPSLHAQRLPIRTYTTADGLAHPTIKRIVRDSRGFLWFCTAAGLSRFDGYAFTNFGFEQGLPPGSINDLLETRTGEYWIASDAGLVRFDPKGTPSPAASGAEPAQARPMFTIIVPRDPDPQAKIVTVLRTGKDGTLWVGTRKGLYRLDRTTAPGSMEYVEIVLGTTYTESAEIAGVLEDRWGSLWIATPEGLIRRWLDGTSMRYTKHLGLPTWYLSGLFEDRSGQLWVTTRGAGLFRFSADATRAEPVVNLIVTKADGLPEDWVFQLFQTIDRRLWAATYRGLAEVFPERNTEGRRVRSYTERHGLSHSVVTALADDLSGNLWLGTENGGAMKLARGGFTTYGRADRLESVRDVFGDRDGHLCFKGYVFLDDYPRLLADPNEPRPMNQLGCFDGQRFETFTPAALTPSALFDWGWVMEGITLQTRSGDWWVGTAAGLYHYPATDHLVTLKHIRPTAVYTTKDGLPADSPFRLFEDSRGDIWISTGSSTTRGLVRWERATGRFRDFAGSPGLPPVNTDQARSFIEDSNNQIWIGFDNGLARYANGAFSFFTASDGMPPGSIVKMHVDRNGQLWLASKRNGLIRVDNPGGARPTFVSYTTDRGLSSNNIRVITEDGEGFLYVGGGQGLDRFDPATGRVKHFAAAEGLPPGVLMSAHRARDGVLWFGTSNGIARLTPVADLSNSPPVTLISGLKVAGTSRLLSALGEQEVALGNLAPGRNQLQIDFIALAFGSGEMLRYQFKLDGADHDWTVPGEQRTVTYARLAPGRYRFLVHAINSDGVVSNVPAQVSFRVLSPIWRRWWFLTLVAVGAAAAVAGLYRYRVRRVIEMANMRTRIATDLHDDIGANLTRIALMSEVASRTGDVSPLESIGRIARESVGSMSDIVWAINPKRESLRDLVRRMRQHAEEVFAHREVDLVFEAPGENAGPRLGMDVRRDLLLIFKEAVSNAARHSQCSRIAIHLRLGDGRLELVIADNGVGFSREADQDGQGLSSMERRARRLRGSCRIDSAVGRGTTVSVEVAV